MNKTTKTKGFYAYLAVFLSLALFLSACAAPATPAPGAESTQAPAATQAPAETQPPAVTQLPSATEAPAATQASSPAETQPAVVTASPESAAGAEATLDTGGIAQSVSSQTVPAVSASAGGPIWEVLPQYTLLTLEGYPVSNHLLKPQIFLFPAGDLAAANEGAGKIASDLQALLASQQASQNLPFLPLFNASQVFHAQVKYLDFKNGKGVRFLTEFDQAPLPVNNHELIYTFQGLTSDGKTYVAAVLPVTHPSLPADEKVTGTEPAEFTSDFPKYLADLAANLEQQPASSFTPDLSKLDAMMSSLEVK